MEVLDIYNDMGTVHDFRMFKETYRGKGERGLLRIKIIASLYNHRIALCK